MKKPLGAQHPGEAETPNQHGDKNPSHEPDPPVTNRDPT